MPQNVLCIRHLGHGNFWNILHDAAQMQTHTCKNTGLKGCLPLLLTVGQADAADHLLCSKALIDMGAMPQSFTIAPHKCHDLALMGDAPLYSTSADMCISYGIPQNTLEIFAANMGIPVLNGCSDKGRLGAAMADIALMRALTPDLDTVRIAWVGGATPLAHSLIEASMYVPFELFMALPEWGEPDKDLLGLALKTGAKIFLTREAHLAVDEAHYVYVGAGPQANTQRQENSLSPLLSGMTVDSALMNLARPGARVLLGETWSSACRVEASLLEGPASLYKEQLEYAVRIQKILLPWLLAANS